MVGLIPRGGEIISFVGVGLARGSATLADTQDPPCADETDSGKVWRVLLAGVVGWVWLLAGYVGRWARPTPTCWPAMLADGRDPPLHAGRLCWPIGETRQGSIASAGMRYPRFKVLFTGHFDMRIAINAS